MGKRAVAYVRANHLAVIAICIAVIGTPAAWALGKNSVGSKQIKDGGVKGVDVADDTLTGKDILEGSLAQVPSAKAAGTATSATRAVTATSASSVGGVKESFFSVSAQHEDNEGTTLRQNGVDITLTCEGPSSQAAVDVTPLAAGTFVKAAYGSAHENSTTMPTNYVEDATYPDAISFGGNSEAEPQGTFFVRTAGQVAEYDFTVSSHGFGTAEDCFVFGFEHVANL